MPPHVEEAEYVFLENRESARATLSRSKRVNIRLSKLDFSEYRCVPQKKAFPIKRLLPVYCISLWQAALSKVIKSHDALKWRRQEAARRVMQRYVAVSGPEWGFEEV